MSQKSGPKLKNRSGRNETMRKWVVAAAILVAGNVGAV
jgi:hypothetical protein